jgi:hypothetical protein
MPCDQVDLPVVTTLSSIGPIVFQTSPQHSRPGRPSTRGCLAGPRKGVGVVVEDGQPRAPPVQDGEAGCEAEADGDAQVLGPTGGGPQVGLRPVEGAHQARHLAVAREEPLQLAALDRAPGVVLLSPGHALIVGPNAAVAGPPSSPRAGDAQAAISIATPTIAGRVALSRVVAPGMCAAPLEGIGKRRALPGPPGRRGPGTDEILGVRWVPAGPAGSRSPRPPWSCWRSRSASTAVISISA